MGTTIVAQDKVAKAEVFDGDQLCVSPLSPPVNGGR
jgi:hypothetical protein